SHCPPTTTTFNHKLLFYSPIKAGDVSWNWETFLVGKHGRVIKRAGPTIDPASLAVDIETELTRV
ncbi:unnamed protein product, partial [Lymnaea stagnalis]